MVKQKAEMSSAMDANSSRVLRRTSARLATRLSSNVSTDIEDAKMEVNTPLAGAGSNNRKANATARPRGSARGNLYNTLTSSLRASADSPSSISSFAAGSVGDPASRYTTPGTSVAVTPRDSGLQSRPPNFPCDQTPGSRPRVTTAERLQQLNNKRTVPIRTTKRKRTFDTDFSNSEITGARRGDTDDQLARALQLEEHGESFGLDTDKIADFSNKSSSRSTRGAKKSRLAISDSDESSDFNVDDRDTQEDDENEEFEVQTMVAAKKGVRSRRLRRPAPAAGSRRAHALPRSTASANQHSRIELSPFDKSDPSSLSDFTFHGSEAESSDDSLDPLGAVDSSHDTAIPNPAATAAVHPTTRGPRGGRWARAARRSYPTRAERDRLKLEKHHPELCTMWEDLKNTPIIPAEKASQPVHITRTLKPFQLEGLNWMVKQEQTKFNGGLLGDEMGMGKTIQAVSLIMSDYPAKLPSLVLVPPVALLQWQSEIGEYTDGKLKVLVYHGASKDRLSQSDMERHDVVLMTYSGLESIFRREQKGFKRGSDLIKEDSVIHSITWHRVILDEAHSIKSRNSNTSKACFALNANHKWCLSGTPLQNRIGELFSLLKFLEITPFAYYMCKSCPCKEIHWNFLERRRCSKCKHGPMDHVSLFNKELLDPIQRHGNTGAGKEAFANLQILLDRVMLRRLKKDHVASMELPPKRVVIHREVFNEIELDLAASIMTKSTRQFDNYVAQGVMLNNYANIFGLIMQMRQVADHPDLLLRRQGGGSQEILVCEICNDVAEEPIQSKCRHTFCRRCIKSFIKTFAQTFEDAGEPNCPRCYITLSIDLEIPSLQQDELLVKKSSIINRIKMENWTSSTKIEMLVYDLYKLRSSKQTHKSIVFSQFTSMLQLIEWRLRRAGLKTVMLDGTMTPSQRASSIKYFMENVDVEVFLVSLKAGGVALNLTEASRVFIVDPWWNPATEWQSADRCHRIGQRRPCVITRLCIEDSVESRMVLLQEKKANMINGTMNADQKAMESLTPEDMEFLFRGT